MNIKDLIQELSKKDSPWLVPATVTAVNGKFCDVSPINGDSDILDVQLQGNDESNGILISPKIGSVVIVGLTSPCIGVVIMYGEVDSIYFHGDQYGGLVKISSLITKLNNLENKVNSIISTYDSHTHPVSGVLAGVTTNLITGPLTPTEQSELENTNVKHG